jgi:uncharacterized protein YecE (DUF72 family)
MPSTPARIRIGISGWRYPPWRGLFYPPDLPQRQELEYASACFPVIELNGSFYSLQRPESYALWYEQTPEDFIFSIKAPRYITHIRRLRDVEAPMANLFASGVFNLKEKLGPFLWQFPPTFKFNPDLVESFFAMLPQDNESAAQLARKRDKFMSGRSRLAIDANRPMRHAMEVRNETFLDKTFVRLLRKYKVALVIADTAGHWPLREDITSDFVYMRLHGEKRLYAGGYSDASLTRWAKRIAAWHAGDQPKDAHLISEIAPPTKKPRDVFCFFDNTDIKLRAPFDAASISKKLHLPARQPVVKHRK